MFNDEPQSERWDPQEPSCSGEGTCDPWEEEGPDNDLQPTPQWDPLWDAFDPYDQHEEPEPDYGDFWPDPDDTEET
jgi:hypothetical protein